LGSSAAELQAIAGTPRPVVCVNGVPMLNRETSIKLLNKSIGDELSAVHQYLYFHFHLEDQGLGPLAILFRTTAIQEMGHIAALSERVLFLKGDITLQASMPVERIQDPTAILEKAMQLEEGSILDYNNFAIECGKAADSKTKQLFETLVTDEERHYDQFEKQAENIRRFGANYLALQSFNSAPEPPAGPTPTAAI